MLFFYKKHLLAKMNHQIKRPLHHTSQKQVCSTFDEGIPFPHLCRPSQKPSHILAVRSEPISIRQEHEGFGISKEFTSHFEPWSVRVESTLFVQLVQDRDGVDDDDGLAHYVDGNESTCFECRFEYTCSGILIN